MPPSSHFGCERLRDSRADGFGLGVEIEHIVPHLASPARLFVASERKCGVEDVVAVDPYGSGAKLLDRAMRFADVARPYSCGETV